jgi:leucyl aminopeptidase
MNFEIQKLSLSRACATSSDALLVLWPSDLVPDAKAQDPLSPLLAQAIEHGDFELKAGAVLAMYGPQGMAARHVILACTGENKPGQIRSAVQAGWGAMKSAKIKRLQVHVVGQASVQGLQMALSSLADASYSYTTTLSKPKARSLKQVQISTEHTSPALSQAVAHAQALVAGVELAKEWANRPANHATPTHLAQAAKGLAKGAAFKCEVLGPKEVAKLFYCVALQRSRRLSRSRGAGGQGHHL